MNDPTPLKPIIVEFLKTMLEDLKRRSYDEAGDQKMETLQRVGQLQSLINQLTKSGAPDYGPEEEG